MNDRLRRLFPIVAALASGLAMAFALPPWGWWPLAFVGLVGLERLIADQPRANRFRRGWLIGAGLYFPSQLWMQDLTTPGYVVASITYSTMLGVAVAMVPARAPWRWLGLPGAIALWEVIRWSWPFGGVPLSSLAISQVASPLAPVLRVGGWLLLVEVAVIVAMGLGALLARRWVAVGVAALVALVAVGGSALAPSGQRTGGLEVALVQGGGPQGTRADDTDPRVVFERHLAASEAVDTPVDLVLWPEDVVDINEPVEDTEEGEALAALARRLDATLVVGVVQNLDRETFRNASIAFDPSGEVIDEYEKVHRVPFGEYVPLRSIIEPFAPDFLPTREARVGDGPAELSTPAGQLSVAISWEIFFGDRVREGVGNGAEIVLNPTNGSSFSGTMVQGQQVATSRTRAIESGRWVLQAAPTGFSAIVAPDGDVVERTDISEQVVVQGNVGLREGETVFTRVGLLPALSVAVTALVLAWLAAWRERVRRTAPPTAGPEADMPSGSVPARAGGTDADDRPAVAEPAVPPSSRAL